jgi:hypothetical protein
MTRTFDVSFSYSQIAIFDSNMERPFNRWRREHVAQGFAWRPTSVCFGTLHGGGKMRVTFALADHLRVSDDTTRAIRVPFSVVPPGTVEVGYDTTQVLTLPPGQYDLLYEAGGSSEYDQWCRFSLAPASGNPAEILRQDADLNPTADLTMDGEPA